MSRIPGVESREDGLHVKLPSRRLAGFNTLRQLSNPDLAAVTAARPEFTDLSTRDVELHPPLIGINGLPTRRSTPPRGDMQAALDRLGNVRPNWILLATDFDGTLAPIVFRPSEARPLPANLVLIARLAELGVHVALISGRADHDLRHRLPLPGMQLMGDNGMGEITHLERRALERFNRKAGMLVAPMPGVWIERKPGTTSLHYRGAPDAGSALLTAVLPLATPFGLRVTRGRMVIEVAPERSNKSRALALLIEDIQPRAVIYAGDDEPDATVFRLLRDSPRRHLAIGVSSEERPVERFPDCDLVVDGPEGMADFLHRLLERVVRHRPD